MEPAPLAKLVLYLNISYPDFEGKEAQLEANTAQRKGILGDPESSEELAVGGVHIT